MPRFNIVYKQIYFVIFCTAVMVATGTAAYGQTDPVIYIRHTLHPEPTTADVRPDIELYHSRIERNRYDRTQEVRQSLMRTVPLETLIEQYREHGFKVVYDSLSLFDLFDVDRTVFSKEEQAALLETIYDANKSLRDKRLQIFADHMSARLMDNAAEFDRKIERFEDVIRQAERIGDDYWVAYTTREIWFRHFYGERYARSFAWLRRLEKALDRVDDDYPYKGLEMVWSGIAYYRFHDFDKAIPAFLKALEYRKPEDASLGGNYLRTWSYLAAYYHEQGRLDSAAYYNRTILSSNEGMICYRQHLDFAICNLGRIEMQKGNYDSATALLEAGLEYIEQDKKSSDFTCGVYIALGECYLAKGDTETAAIYIDKARQSIPGNSQRNGYKRLRSLYALQSSYYFATGEGSQANVYLDSALIATSRFERLTSERQILLGEQELQEAELALKNERFERQKYALWFLSIVAGLIFCACLVFLRLYRRQQAAYRALAEKAGQWANCEGCTAKQVTGGTAAPTAEERRLADKLEEFMTVERPYTDPGLSLDSLAALTGINRNQLSRIINKVFEVNFNQYVNEYRIKYAVRLMSDPQSVRLSTEQVMERSGLTNRNAFYTLFRQATGLTPAQYRKAISGLEAGNNLFSDNLPDSVSE